MSSNAFSYNFSMLSYASIVNMANKWQYIHTALSIKISFYLLIFLLRIYCQLFSKILKMQTHGYVHKIIQCKLSTIKLKP